MKTSRREGLLNLQHRRSTSAVASRAVRLLSTEPHGSFVEPHRDGIPVGRAGPAVAAGPSGRRDGGVYRKLTLN